MKFRLYFKVGLIVGLALLLLIPLGMISIVVHERDSYRDQVISDIENVWTGHQTVSGPVLVLPYWVDVEQTTIDRATGREDTRTRRVRRVLYRLPETLKVQSAATTETRSRGIYSVPVYTSQHTVLGEFDVSWRTRFAAETAGFVGWLPASVSVQVSDIRGINGTPTFTWNGQPHAMVAGGLVPNLESGVHAEVSLPEGVSTIPLSLELGLRGSQALKFLPLAQEMTVSLSSPWPHPKFDGHFLPGEREVSSEGFGAIWSMSSFATDAQSKLTECVEGKECFALKKLSFGVKFFEPVDIYVKVNRAIKYGILFIGLTFVAFFLTETLSDARLHPLQYALVGLALAVFYLLLVSLSEHLGFVWAYLCATVACAGLIGIYLKGVLGQTRLSALFSAGIGLLYSMLFAILRSEDFALLMGSLLLFGMLALVMVLTRRVDWYAIGSVRPQ